VPRRWAPRHAGRMDAMVTLLLDSTQLEVVLSATERAMSFRKSNIVAYKSATELNARMKLAEGREDFHTLGWLRHLAESAGEPLYRTPRIAAPPRVRAPRSAPV